ncbi:MAG: calcium/sodium antiporter [Leptospiraceae bacterium]|nr:calcium/sodium antiporter [Leptospiraceae bacterium]
MPEFVTYLLFIVGFAALIKGADMLVDGAASLAQKIGVSTTVVGLTVVAFGTSLPEFIVNILASTRGQNGLAYGNIVGSNIANVFLILGVTALFGNLKVKETTATREIPFALLASIVLFILTLDVEIDGAQADVLSRSDGFLLIAFFSIFLYYIYTVITGKKDFSESEEQGSVSLSTLKSVIFVILGLIGLGLGGEWIVNGAVKIATVAGLSERVIGLTIVAVGTSLPELAASIVAARKKQPEIAVGNVVGSNIFNIFWVLGISASIRPLPIPDDSYIDLGLALFSAFLLYIFLYIGQRHVLQRWQGISFLSVYVGYTIWLVLNK